MTSLRNGFHGCISAGLSVSESFTKPTDHQQRVVDPEAQSQHRDDVL